MIKKVSSPAPYASNCCKPRTPSKRNICPQCGRPAREPSEMLAALTDVGKIVLALLIFTLILSVFRIL